MRKSRLKRTTRKVDRLFGRASDEEKRAAAREFEWTHRVSGPAKGKKAYVPRTRE